MSNSDSDLLAAMGAVGQSLGISICPVIAADQDHNPINAIARASQIRIRRVKLPQTWWRKEQGAFLAFTQAEQRPIAVLPSHQGYVIFDPLTQTRTRLKVSDAKRLAHHAYILYRALPNRADNAIALLKFAIQGNRKEIASILGLGILGTMLGMSTTGAIAILVNHVIPDHQESWLWQIGLLLSALAVGQFIFAIAQNILTLRLESKLDYRLQPAIWDRLLRLSPVFFRHYTSGDLLNRVMSVSQIQQKLSGATQRTLLSSIFALLNLGLMLVYSWQLALIGIGLAVLIASMTVRSGIGLVKRSRQQQELDSGTYGLAVQLIQGVAKLRIAVAEERAFAAWQRKYNPQVKLKERVQRIHDRVSVFNEILPATTIILLFSVALRLFQLTQPQLSIGTFLAFYAALGVFIQGVIQFSNTVIDLGEIVPIWERAQPILRSLPEFDSTQINPGQLNGQITVDQVTFRYAEHQPAVLKAVSLVANPGEFIAIVGASGSGKSTLFRLLLGFETPETGTITYDGKDLVTLDLQAVRRQFGVVLQHGKIGAGSMLDNITAGAIVSLDQAWDAARMAGLAAEIEHMPMGIHTMVSEGGTNLSGGQRQRLLIARALVSKPKIVLMDEATSALDNRTQAIVSASLTQLNATRVVIAHRLSTIRNADRIYVMEAGQIVQVGSFSELITREGLFAHLVNRQST